MYRCRSLQLPAANFPNPDACLYSAGCVTGDSIPYWLNDQCYAWVIDVDDYCCEVEWDNICQLTYDYCAGTWTGPIPLRIPTDDTYVYPNPTSGIINVNKKVDIEVLNYLGGVIISEKNINTLDMSYLSPGMYNLRIKTNGSIMNVKIIKK